MVISDLYKLNEIELVYRPGIKILERPQVVCSQDAYKIFLEIWDKNKLEFIEQSKLMLLNRASRVLGIYNISSGGTSATIVDPKQVFIVALKMNASSIILAHNHPSSNIKPSEADIKLTNRLSQAGNFLDISLADHIIVTKQAYYSFVDDGRLNL